MNTQQTAHQHKPAPRIYMDAYTQGGEYIGKIVAHHPRPSSARTRRNVEYTVLVHKSAQDMFVFH